MFTKLRPEHQEIRLLELLPGQPDEEIMCTLSVVSLRDKPRYEALSYCWGSADITCKILVNGIPKAVTINLFCALRRFRRHSQTRTLWIDAICINQDSLREKENQVPLMNEIYRNCSEEIIWLGEHELDEDKGEFIYGEIPAFESIRQWGDLGAAKEVLTEGKKPNTIADCYDFAFAIIVLLAHDFHVFELPLLPREHFKKSTENLSATDIGRALWAGDLPSMTSGPFDIDTYVAWRDTASAIMLLFSRKYWTRVWILQEIALAPSALLHFGRHMISLDLLFAAQEQLLKHYHTCCLTWGYEAMGREYTAMTGVVEQLEILEQLRGLRLLAQSDSPISLYDTINALTDKGEATDPKDQIYGLLGMLQGNPKYLSPNYTYDVAQVYTKAMYSIILERKDLLALQFTDRSRSEAKKLPTWVPDWSASLELDPVPYDWSLFNASTGLSFDTNLIEGSILETRSTIIDQITETGTRMVFEYQTLTAFLTRLTEWRMKMNENSSIRQKYQTSGMARSFFRTILADTLIDTTGRARRLTAEDCETISSWWWYTVELLKTTANQQEWGGLSLPVEFTDVFETIKKYLRSRRFFVTKNHRVGMGVSILSRSVDDEDARREARVGDVICLIGGCNVPVVLRPLTATEDGSEGVQPGPSSSVPRYSYVGSCYLDGVMDGEIALSEGFATQLIHIMGTELAKPESLLKGGIEDESGPLQLLVADAFGSGSRSRAKRNSFYRGVAYDHFHAVAKGENGHIEGAARDALIPILNGKMLGKAEMPREQTSSTTTVQAALA